MLTAIQISTDRSTQHFGRCKQHYCPHPVLPSRWWRSISGTYICGQFFQERDSDAPVATYSVAGHWFLICVSSHIRTHILDSFMTRLRDPAHPTVGAPASSSDKNIRMSLLVSLQPSWPGIPVPLVATSSKCLTPSTWLSGLPTS